MKKQEQVAEVARKASLSLMEGGDDPFQLDNAVLFAFSYDGTFRVLWESGDVYDALLSVKGHKLHQWEVGIGVLSTGWAAPLDADGTVKGAPSRHTLRKRCRLVSCATKKHGIISAFRFQDDPTEVVLDYGDATGSLADAVREALATMTA